MTLPFSAISRYRAVPNGVGLLPAQSHAIGWPPCGHTAFPFNTASAR